MLLSSPSKEPALGSIIGPRALSVVSLIHHQVHFYWVVLSQSLSIAWALVQLLVECMPTCIATLGQGLHTGLAKTFLALHCNLRFSLCIYSPFSLSIYSLSDLHCKSALKVLPTHRPPFLYSICFLGDLNRYTWLCFTLLYCTSCTLILACHVACIDQRQGGHEIELGPICSLSQVYLSLDHQRPSHNHEHSFKLLIFGIVCTPHYCYNS